MHFFNRAVPGLPANCPGTFPHCYRRVGAFSGCFGGNVQERDIALGPQRSDEYVVALLAFQPRGLSREQKLLERLLCCALIEARSCERFRLLSLHCSDADLRRFYHAFMVSEAGHYRLFMDLAEGYFPKDKVRNRWEAYLQYEAGVMEQFSNRSGRIH